MHAMELELWNHLQCQKPPNFVREITEHILKNEDVQFHWSIVACDWEDEEAEALLEQLGSQCMDSRMLVLGLKPSHFKSRKVYERS